MSEDVKLSDAKKELDTTAGSKKIYFIIIWLFLAMVVVGVIGIWRVHELRTNVDIDAITGQEMQQILEHARLNAYLGISGTILALGAAIFMCFRNLRSLRHYNAEILREKANADKANQEKTAFLGSMSHEIRTPLHTILGFDDKIIHSSKDSTIIEYSLRIQAAARALLSTLNDVIDYAKIEDGTLKNDNSDYTVQDTIQDIVDYGKTETEMRKLCLEVSVDEKLPIRLNGDEVRIAQIATNLMTNAVKFTKTGTIRIVFGWEPSASENDKERGLLVLQVADTGIGMRPEVVKSIKDNFRLYGRNNHQSIPGVGLGLTIVLRLLYLMEGDFELESELDRGTTFTVKIPQRRISPERMGQWDPLVDFRKILTEKQYRVKMDGVRMLIADDNQLNREIIQHIFKESGAVLDEAENGQEVVDLLKGGAVYDLMILDHMMPVMDGVDAIRIIKQEKLAPNSKFIIFTANAVNGVKEEYLEAGFDAYLSKPIRNADFIKTIKNLLPPEKCRLVEEEQNTVVAEQKQNTGNNGSLEQNGSGEKQKQTQQSREHVGTSGAQSADNLSDRTETVLAQEIQNVSRETEMLPKLQSISGLDTSLGLSYCGNDVSFYLEMLETYVEGYKGVELDNLYEQENWKDYRIGVHALKSTSLSIGAASLSEEAKALEFAARDLQIEEIREHHKDVMEHYRKLKDELVSCMQSNEIKANVPVEKIASDGRSTILVVDDDLMNIKLAETLFGADFNIMTARSGEDAFAALEQEMPNLILLDVHMPEMDGHEVIRRLKSDHRYKSIPVIFLTADNDGEAEIQGFHEGAMDYIAKPFRKDIAVQRIHRILQLDYLKKYLKDEVIKQTATAEERRKSVERISLQMVQTLANTIDAKDNYTNGHSTRVAKYSVMIAKRMNYEGEALLMLEFSALLHDIGKIGVPDEIINKTERLTDEEYEKIKMHPVIGSNILKNITELPDIGIGARWHHERYDGRGYPDQLRGRDIPEIARIIGVADSYDAMTSKRSYRNVMPQEKVRDEIQRCKGTQFDPDIADIMLAMIDEDTEYTMHEQ
ncbi:MAG: response regulator [Lachnospiraceae bacterium]